MARTRKAFLVIAVLLIAAGAGTWLVLDGPRLAGPKRGELLLYGNVDLRDARLAFEISDRIRTLQVDEGDQVVAGQLLAELDDRRARETLALREAQLETARQQLLLLQRGSRKEDIEQARGEVAALRAELKEADINLARQLSLLESKAASRQDVDDARARRDATAGRLRAARANLARLVAGPRVEDIDAASARVAAAEAALDRARTDLEDTRLKAPSDGVIQNRFLEAGEMASPQTPVFSLALTNPLWVRAYLPEPDLGRLHEGMRAEVRSDSYPDRHYDAWIGYISPVAEFTPRNVETTDLRTRLVYRLRVFVCNDHGELRLGMPVTVRVPLPQAETAGRSGCESR